MSRVPPTTRPRADGSGGYSNGYYNDGPTRQFDQTDNDASPRGVRVMEGVRTKSADLVDMAGLHPQTAKTRRHRARMWQGPLALNEHKPIDGAETRAGVGIRVGVEVVRVLGATLMQASRLKVSSNHSGNPKPLGRP
jgi:hypothetical protein